ncbi:MAG: FtsL-like putative cell division protein [Bacteroidia bacterium]
MNKIKEKPAEQFQEINETKIKAPARERKKSNYKFLKNLNVFAFNEKDMFVKALPFIFFFTGLVLLYIANSYSTEKIIREIDASTRDIKELRSEYISTKSELMFKSNQSQVAGAVLPAGLKESRVAPKKITVEVKKQNKKSGN